MLTIACKAPFQNVASLDVFKCWLDNDLVLFITTNSIKSELDLSIEPDGEIRGVGVVGIDTLFNKLEEIESPLADGMTTTVDYERKQISINGYKLEAYSYDGGLMIPLTNAIRCCRPLADFVKLRLMKVCQYSLDETALLTIKDTSFLLDKFGRPKQTKKLTKCRGFGIASKS